MARPRKTSEELKKSGARAGRIAERIAEENIAAGIKAVEKQKELAKRGLLLETFIAQVKQERDTFFERLVPDQTVCREPGEDFDWRPGHSLRGIATYGEQIATRVIVSGEFARLVYARFLGDLLTDGQQQLRGLTEEGNAEGHMEPNGPVASATEPRAAGANVEGNVGVSNKKPFREKP